MARNNRPPAKCGTDAGYYRHRRILKEDPCDECKEAHRVAGQRPQYRRPAPDRPAVTKPRCVCGRVMLPSSEVCCMCNKERKKRSYYDPTDDPKRPVSWIRRGVIWHPVYEQSEVA